jgi:hypothetical protein
MLTPFCPTVTNTPTLHIQLVFCFSKAEEDIYLLADPTNDEDAIEINNSHQREYYTTRIKNASESFVEMTKMSQSKMH